MSEGKAGKRMVALAFAYGIELVAVVVVGLFAGKAIGSYWNMGEWGAVIGCFIGFSGWTWRMARLQTTADGHNDTK
ncbi:MAG: AtpZ/AtpI family protein [Bdellovibrionaceae bacterium]|nr:AtpZ/AtpI family protein [Pseudobdellovibrionaceae bacterium]